MLLAIDIGNTNITIGLFDKEEIVGTFRMTTKIPRTSDEYGTFLYNLLHNPGSIFSPESNSLSESSLLKHSISPVS